MTANESTPDFIDLPPLIPRARPQAAPLPARPARDLGWNVLTVVVLLGMTSVILGIVSLVNNPYSAFNPFQPPVPTLVMSVSIPTEAATPTPPATATASLPLETPAPAGGLITPMPTFTATLPPTETNTPGPSPTATIFSIFPFIQRGEVKIIDASSFHEHDTCKLWVAGQAFDLKGAPLTGVTIMLGGSLERKTVSQLSLTGTALQYGPAGYEFTIAEQPAASRQSVWVQLFDQSMNPLSARIPFDTAAECAQNLILVNFRQVK